MCITETFLKEYISDAQVKIDNYSCFRADRNNRKQGGALVYVHDDLLTSNDFRFDDGVCEAVAVNIDTMQSVVVCVYRPPDATAQSFKKMLTQVQDYLDGCDQSLKKYITGDFNLPNIDWSTLEISHALSRDYSLCASQLVNFVEKNFLTQTVVTPTRGTAILDLILVSDPQLLIEVETSDTLMSDHKLVEAKLAFDARNPAPNREPPAFDPHSFRGLDLHSSDCVALTEAIDSVDWHTMQQACEESYGEDCLDEFAELIRLIVLQLAISHCPEKTVSKAKISRHRRVLRRKRRKLNVKLKCLKRHQPLSSQIAKLETELNLLEYNISEHITRELNAKESRAISKIAENPRYFFSYAKRFSSLKSNIGPLKDTNGTLKHNPKDMADLLQAQYSSVFSDPAAEGLDSEASDVHPADSHLSDIPITEKDMAEAMKELDPWSSAPDGEIPAKILKDCRTALCVPLVLLWKRSFATGHIPEAFKQQFVAPIYKKDSKADPANYRPVSLTSHIIKIFERVIRKYLVQYLEQNNLISAKQHGFRKGRSCLTQLLGHVDQILKNLLNGVETDVIYLDYAKAFDKVDHTILLKKLSLYGITGRLHAWLTQFLRGRHQVVVVDGQHSQPAAVTSGVPQGTVLGPILFIIYINEIEKVLSEARSGSFADDTRLMKAIDSVQDTILMQRDLNATVDWSKKNNMMLHESKFELLCYKTKPPPYLEELPFYGEYYQYTTPGGFPLQQKPLVKDLGVYLSSSYSWTPHISKVVQSARKMASWVLGVFKDRSESTMLHLYKSMVRCRLEYCSPVWSPTSVSDIQTLEGVQRYFTDKILGCADMDYYERLKHLRLQSVQRRRERYSIIHIWKILNNIAPNDIGFKFTEHPRHGTKITLSPINRHAKQSAIALYESSFAVHAAKLWNILPKEVNSVNKLECFKTKLGRYLEGFPDTPPTTGYTPANANSLLDWKISGVGGARVMLRP